ncbi:MAG: cache domain-containing protein, partial [Betaproteobacteria bacterium]|nr:cache domain-containing protein [Betaproteobacteria bacterium]
MSIFKKLFTLVCCTILVLLVSLCLLSYFLIPALGDSTAKARLGAYKSIVDRELKNFLIAQASLGDMLRNNSQFALAVANSNKDVIRRTVKEFTDFPMIDFITVCDTKGVVLLRSYSDKAGDTLPQTRVSMRVPLAEGRVVSGMEPGTQIKLTLATGVPIHHDGKIVGVAIIGMDLSSGGFVKEMKEMMHSEFTVFLDDTRISTTVMNKDNKPAIDTKLNNDAIYQKVIGKGETAITRNTIMGTDYDTVYWPWKDLTGKNAGMLFAGLSRTEIKKTQNNIILYFVLIGLGIGAIMLAIGVWVARAITNPLGQATTFAEQVAKGDLEGTLSVASKDEVGTLSRALG